MQRVHWQHTQAATAAQGVHWSIDVLSSRPATRLWLPCCMQEICTFCASARNTSAFLKLLTTGGVKEQCSALAHRLAQLTEQLLLAVGLDTHAQTGEAVSVLRRQANELVGITCLAIYTCFAWWHLKEAI